VYDFLIVGGGVIGLATGAALQKRFSKARLAILEKEPGPARHQSGRNSGVIHSGIYYPPGTMKARLARAGNEAMVAFCQAHGIPVETCGKLIIATRPDELPGLEALYQRAMDNAITVEKLDPHGIQDKEPHVTNALAGIYVPSTGVVDYRKVCEALVEEIEAKGGQICYNTQVVDITPRAGEYILETTLGQFEARFLINCAGLYSDRIARMAGQKPPVRIIPFRGEFRMLKPEKAHLVNHMIYPVPHPALPFLGVHLTRSITGEVHAGPNALLAFKREGYLPKAFDLKDAIDTLAFRGFWLMALKYAKPGLIEIVRSVQKDAFIKNIQRLVPEIQPDDLVPAESGVRAQAVNANGALVDDFMLLETPYAIHVLNAPSPAATAALKIAEEIVSRIPRQYHLKEASVKTQEALV